MKTFILAAVLIAVYVGIGWAIKEKFADVLVDRLLLIEHAQEVAE